MDKYLVLAASAAGQAGISSHQQSSAELQQQSQLRAATAEVMKIESRHLREAGNWLDAQGNRSRTSAVYRTAAQERKAHTILDLQGRLEGARAELSFITRSFAAPQRSNQRHLSRQRSKVMKRIAGWLQDLKRCYASEGDVGLQHLIHRP